MTNKASKKVNQRGFSMIEILVTLVVVATALLGTAGLQAYAMKTSKGSEFRNQAIFLSSDIVERMEANKVEAAAGNYVVAAGAAAAAASTACDVAVCDATALRVYDLTNWQAAVAALPQGSGSIVLTTPGNPVTFAPAIYTITVRWVDRATAAAGSTAVAAPENFAVTTTKAIRN